MELLGFVLTFWSLIRVLDKRRIWANKWTFSSLWHTSHARLVIKLVTGRHAMASACKVFVWSPSHASRNCGLLVVYNLPSVFITWIWLICLLYIPVGWDSCVHRSCEVVCSCDAWWEKVVIYLNYGYDYASNRNCANLMWNLSLPKNIPHLISISKISTAKFRLFKRKRIGLVKTDFGFLFNLFLFI